MNSFINNFNSQYIQYVLLKCLPPSKASCGRTLSWRRRRWRRRSMADGLGSVGRQPQVAHNVWRQKDDLVRGSRVGGLPDDVPGLVQEGQGLGWGESGGRSFHGGQGQHLSGHELLDEGQEAAIVQKVHINQLKAQISKVHNSIILGNLFNAISLLSFSSFISLTIINYSNNW